MVQNGRIYYSGLVKHGTMLFYGGLVWHNFTWYVGSTLHCDHWRTAVWYWFETIWPAGTHGALLPCGNVVQRSNGTVVWCWFDYIWPPASTYGALLQDKMVPMPIDTWYSVPLVQMPSGTRYMVQFDLLVQMVYYIPDVPASLSPNHLFKSFQHWVLACYTQVNLVGYYPTHINNHVFFKKLMRKC